MNKHQHNHPYKMSALLRWSIRNNPNYFYTLLKEAHEQGRLRRCYSDNIVVLVKQDPNKEDNSSYKNTVTYVPWSGEVRAGFGQYGILSQLAVGFVGTAQIKGYIKEFLPDDSIKKLPELDDLGGSVKFVPSLIGFRL